MKEPLKMNITPILLIIVNLLISTICANQDITSKFIGSVKKNVDKTSAATNQISKLRIILLNDLKQNEIPQSFIDSCWSSSQAIKITAKSCPCNQINCSAPMDEVKRRAISVSCMQFCCGSRYKKASIRSISAAEIQEIGKRKFSLKANCERANHSDAFIFARIYDKVEQRAICSAVLIHQKFLITTGICVMKKRSNDLTVKFGSYQDGRVEQIIMHPNFYNTIDTLQHNIAILMLDRELHNVELPCISKSNSVASNLCHVYSWGNFKHFENALKLDNVEVLTKGECYTSHLILGKKHEKYVNKGNNNICVGNENHDELNINLSGSALTCHSRIPGRPQILKGLLTWTTKINFYPHLFTDVTQFDEWIENTVNSKYLSI